MTTHIFIVDSNTFKYHLEYQFAGTGAKEYRVDFLINPNINLSRKESSSECLLVGMIADCQRIRVGDLIIFYLQGGGFYGVFRVKQVPFLDNNDGNQFLKDGLKKSLTFRTLIEPHQVYAEGVTEWEALDEIKNVQSPHQMLWTLIYRKLEGNRGNTMITMFESERLIKLISDKNKGISLKGNNFTFNAHNQKIEINSSINNYSGRQIPIDILPRLIYKYNKGNQFETHLQAYLTQNIDKLPFFIDEKIEWIGNEIYCGFGEQSIDIMLSINGENRKVIPIELKSTVAPFGITDQIKRYVDWIEQYYLPNYLPNHNSKIEPMIISREIKNKNSTDYQNLVSALNNFKLKLRYVEFKILNDEILFEEIQY